MTPILIFKTLVGRDGGIDICDTIEHEGHFWLVPEWLSPPGREWQSPKRMIRVTGMLQDGLSPDYEAQFLLTEPITLSVLHGEEDTGWTVLEEPSYKFVVQKQH